MLKYNFSMSINLINAVASGIIASSLILSPVANAQDAVPITEGEAAPFSGTLLTDEAAADLLSQIRTCGERAESELQFSFDRYIAMCELDKSLLQIQIDSQEQRFENIIFTQDEQLEYLIRTNTTRKLSRETIFILGVGSGVLITVAAAYGLSSASSFN